MVKLVFAFLTFLLCFSSSTFAFDNEPDGFRGLKWGASVEEFKQAYPEATLRKTSRVEYNPAKLVRYSVPASNSTLSGILITAPLEYSFYNNQLESVSITLTGKDSYETLNNQKLLLYKMSMIYGEVKENDGNNIEDFIPAAFSTMYHFGYTWKGQTSIINLTGAYKEPNLTSVLSVSVRSTKLFQQEKANTKPLDRETWLKIRENMISEYRSGW